MNLFTEYNVVKGTNLVQKVFLVKKTNGIFSYKKSLTVLTCYLHKWVGI